MLNVLQSKAVGLIVELRNLKDCLSGSLYYLVLNLQRMLRASLANTYYYVLRAYIQVVVLTRLISHHTQSARPIFHCSCRLLGRLFGFLNSVSCMSCCNRLR